jgi:hypothetical protein
LAAVVASVLKADFFNGIPNKPAKIARLNGRQIFKDAEG